MIWYDTRRNPKNHLLDVFGTVSTDGGLTFSPNFRITDQSFDADAGAFTDATGQTNYYLGDSLGLAVANQTVYAAWTDTRNGNQDVFFTREPISTAPAPPNDRFEPNNTPETATDLGTVVKDHVPKLAIPSGDEDWFRLKAASTGDLTISATPSAPTAALRLELWDASGTTRLATGTAAPGPGVEQLVFPGQAGQSYLIHVVPGVLIAEASTAATSPRYTLDVQSLTADLGTVVHSVQTGTLHLGDGAYYLLTAGASGSLDATLTPGPNVMGSLNLQVLDPGKLTVLATGNPKPDGSIETTVAIQKGQTVLVRVSGGATSAGDFQLEFTNLDQFATPDLKSIMLPDGLGPSHIALGDLNRDGKPDLVVSNTLSNTISVFLGNGDGTFQAPRQFDVGAFALTARGQFIQGLLSAGRDLVIADVNHDGLPDVIVTNYSSADVSVLLGRGDGTFQPQRRFDATSAPTTLGVGDFNGDGQTDLVAVDSPVSGLVTVSSLLGRGDGTFQPQKMLQFQSGSGSFLSTVRLADFNKDGRLDLVIAGLNGANGVPCIRTFLGNGDGTFAPGVTLNDADMFNSTITVGDVNGDGNPDIVAATFNSGKANVFLGHGDGTFQAPQTFFAGQVPTSVTIADLGSQVALPDGTVALGPPDGHPDLVITNAGSPFSDFGLPSLVILPGLFDSQGKYQGFGVPLPLSSADTPLDLVIGDLNGDGAKDVAFVERDGIRITFGKPPVIPPNDTPQTARNLGTVVHVVEPTLTIVPGHEDAYYTLTAPTEAARSPGPEVLDVSGLFQDVAGPGLALELRDAATGVLLGSGPRFRAVVAQGQVLTLHVFGASGADGARGAGAYTLDLDVLPQLVSVEAQPPLPGQGGQPGGPTSSLVLTFQGDRLDPATAQDPAHYRVTWLGPDGRPDTADDQVIPISSIAGSQSVVYDPSANVDVASGKQYPTAVHQTVTLLFAGSLPTGSYRVELSPAILTAPFNEQEQDLLADESQFAGHPVVFVTQGQVEAGSRWEASGLVAPAGNLGDFRAWEVGTPFLTQLHDDLGALLDAGLTHQGDSDGTAITAALNRQIQGRFISGLSVPGRRPVAVLVIWLDPVSFALADPGGSRITYNLQTDAFVARIPSAYVNVTGNIEVVAIPVDLDRGTPSESTYVSDVSDVPARARGGAVYFGPSQDRLEFWELTDGLRTGQRTFDFVLSYAGEDPPGAGPGDHPASPPLPGPGGHPTNPEPHQAPTQPGGPGFNPPALSLSSVTIVTVPSSGGQEGSATASVNSTGQAPVPTRLASGPKDTPRIQPPVASQGAAGANGISGSIPGRPASPDLQLETLRRAAADALGRIVRLFARRSHVLRFLGSLWPISRVVWRDLAKWVLSLRLGADERSAPAQPGVFETPNPEPIEGGDGLLWRDGGRPEMQPRVSPPGGIQALFAIALLVAGVGPGRLCDRPPCGRCRPGPRE